MKRILLAIQIIFLGSCSSSPETFTVFNVDPITAALKNNRIENYEEFIVISDSIINTSYYKIDSNGNVLSEDAFPHIIGGSHNKFKYDSLGRLTNAIYQSDVYSEYTIDYKLSPHDRTVMELWRESGRPYLKRIMIYNVDLNQILRKIEIRGIDTVRNLKFEYKKEKISKVFNKEHLDTEFTYDEKESLKTIKRFYKHDNSEIDYISTKTGLPDSTARFEEGEKYVVYYRYKLQHTSSQQ